MCMENKKRKKGTERQKHRGHREERGKIREMRVMVVGRSLLFIETPYLIKLKGRRLHQSTCCTLPHNTTLLPYT